MPQCQCTDPDHFHAGEEAGQWLLPYIDLTKVSCLNETHRNSCQKIFKPFDQRLMPGGIMLEGEDGEVILRVCFTELVKVASFQLVPVTPETAPARARVFVNRSDVDFNNVHELKPTQVVEHLLPDFEGEVDYPLIPSKFGSVDSIVFHITTAGEESELQILSMGFKGESKGLNPKTVEGIKYEVSAQLKDHVKTDGGVTKSGFDIS
ncbi:hypothetical protein BASA81_004459 [Batrachochytrium salamandrivorans]|nr:hypothetical protein BASA81_004459 [Batrachochytrium salamandrivorans]